MSIPTTQTGIQPLNCAGYRRLLAEVEDNEKRWPRGNEYRAKFAWAIDRARHYAEKTALTAEAILDAWEWWLLRDQLRPSMASYWG